MEIFLGRELSARSGPTSPLQILVAPSSAHVPARDGAEWDPPQVPCVRAEGDRQLRQPIKQGAGSLMAHRRMSTPPMIEVEEQTATAVVCCCWLA